MLKGLAEIERAILARPEELKAGYQEGRIPIGYFCNYVPEELIHAAGLIPIRLISGGEKEPEVSGGEYITPNSCSYAKSCIGYRASGKDPFFMIIDYIVESPACVQMEWVLEALEKYFGIKTIPIGLPRKFNDDEALAYYLKELEDFQARIEEIAQRKITDKDLCDAVDLYNSIRQKLRAIYNLLKGDHPPISWAEVLDIVQAGFVLDRRRYLEILNSILEELSGHQAGEKGNQAGPRILIAGSILASGDKKVLGLVKELGVNIVIDELCTGSRWFWNDVEEPTLEGLGRRYLRKIPCATLPDARRMGNTRRDHLKELIEQYKVAGVISYTLRFCDAYSFKVEDDRKWLDQMGIPLLHINSDYSSISLGQIRTRIEAFIELLQGAK
jgi:benzoyl-CoA reductase/2-hydroxyglutaryl-CoA dehydratase subunit BcrC/BadD/HgdB